MEWHAKKNLILLSWLGSFPRKKIALFPSSIAKKKLVSAIIFFWKCQVGSHTRTTDTQWSLFSSKSQTFGLGQFGQINYWSLGVFSANLTASILALWVPCPCFSLINHNFYKTLSLYIQIPNIYLGSVFEFGPQRIKDLAIVCP